ncbi:MAG: DUF3108 domain-containing protein [Gemmatimonadota bacterium]|nr:DUF3108 domain-containing protein [Gemmatimonadota bacterium]
MRRIVFVIPLVALLAVPISATAQQPPLIDRELFFDDAEISGAQICEEYAGSMQMLDLLSQKIRPIGIEVTGSETVTTGAGTFETWVVTLTPLDGDESGSATLNVTRDAPHLVVRGTTKLPAMMGGGMQETTLTAR